MRGSSRSHPLCGVEHHEKREINMKLRVILLVLSLLAFLSASTGGYLYYSSLKKSAFKEAERQAVARVYAIKKNISFFLSENIKPVKALAGMEELRQTLAQPDDKNTLNNANIILDHFNYALEVEVCYLMDPAGNTIASSNRHALDSFVGYWKSNTGHPHVIRPWWRAPDSGDLAAHQSCLPWFWSLRKTAGPEGSGRSCAAPAPASAGSLP